ncbi:MAG: heme ABC exporter ATP-binding protein CcmA [Actinobacteria bacterium]|nr:heme ABC exporter ATP-binding protein CcmA [Actinomycetota bacterium]
MISLENLTVIYGRTLALDAISPDIRPGVTGLFGPNGAGKSTLLRAVAGLIRSTRGSISIDGTPVDLRSEGTRGRIGYAGHEPGLYLDLSVEENLELFRGLYGAPARRVVEVIEEVGLEQRRAVRVRELSAGFKRRAAVARALLHEPDVLLLDEPYANLDDDASDKLSSAIKGWSGSHRYALIATHGAKRVKSFADAGIIIQRGRVISYRVRSEDSAEEIPV